MGRGIALEVFKFSKSISGIAQNRFESIPHHYSSRSVSYLDYYQGAVRTDKRKYSFIPRATSIWKKVPISIKQCDTKNSFKNAYDLWKLNQGYADVSSR